RVRVGGEHAFAILGVEQAREQVGVGLPFVDAETEDRLDLRAREDVRADGVQRVDVDDERELLDQRAIAPRDLLRGEVVVAVLAQDGRCRGHLHGIGLFGGWRLPRTGYRGRLTNEPGAAFPWRGPPFLQRRAR